MDNSLSEDNVRALQERMSPINAWLPTASKISKDRTGRALENLHLDMSSSSSFSLMTLWSFRPIFCESPVSGWKLTGGSNQFVIVSDGLLVHFLHENKFEYKLPAAGANKARRRAWMQSADLWGQPACQIEHNFAGLQVIVTWNYNDKSSFSFDAWIPKDAGKTPNGAQAIMHFPLGVPVDDFLNISFDKPASPVNIPAHNTVYVTQEAKVQAHKSN